MGGVIIARICSNCGANLDEDSEFCSNCGIKVDKVPMYPFYMGENAKTAGKTNAPKKASSSVNAKTAGNLRNSRNFMSTGGGSVKIRNFVGENDNIIVVDKKGPFTVIEYEKDLSVGLNEAIIKYFSSKMNVRPRQLVVDLSKTSGIYLQAGAMQWMSGSTKLSSGVNGIGDFGKKFLKSTVTGETAVKPEYTGNGFLVTEQTYRHLIILDLNDWNNNLMIDDGLFLAAEKSVELTVQKRTNLSSALASKEGLFNTVLYGNGLVCLESVIPLKELIIIELENDTVSIDGPMAIAWTSDLQLTVERSAKSFVGSAVSGEGFVNVYRGTGKILMAPLSGRIKYRDLPMSGK